MLLKIDPSGQAPIYRQIADQIASAIAAGRLKPGDKLPSHREVAADLVINHLTVKKAYESLEAAGLIGTQRGMGTYVQDSRAVLGRADDLGRLRKDVRQVVRRARELGLQRHDGQRLWLELREEEGTP